VLHHGLRLNPLPRAFLLGLPYLALHFLAAVFLHEGMGVFGAGPWVPAGLALAFLVMGGLGMLPFVAVGCLISAFVLAPGGAVLMQVAWPLVLSLSWAMVAWQVRRVGGLLRPWSVSATVYFIVFCAACTLFISAAGAALLRSGPHASLLPVSSLMLEIAEPQLLGLLLFTPLVLGLCGAFRPQDTPSTWIADLRLSEVFPQLIALAFGCWLLATCSPATWILSGLILGWWAVRHGLMGGIIAALALCLAATCHPELSRLAADGPRPIIYVEVSIVLAALALGSWADEQRARLSRLRASCERMDLLMEHGAIGIWDWERGGVIRLEGAWHHLGGFSVGASTVGEIQWYAHVHPDDVQRVRNAREAHLRGESARYEVEYRLRGAAGLYRWVLDRGTVFHRDATGRADRMLGLCSDLAPRRHGEGSQLRHLDLIEGASDPMACADLHGNVFFANTSLRALRGDSADVGPAPRHISDYFSEQSARLLLRDALPQVMEVGAWWGNLDLQDSQGRLVPSSIGLTLLRDGQGKARSLGLVTRRMDLVGVPGSERDPVVLSAACRLERQESLRQLAAGAVHGFNNVLMGIVGNAFLVGRHLPPDSPARPFLAQVEGSAQRGSQLCHSLQLCAGKLPVSASAFDVNARIESLLPELRGEGSRGDRLEFLPARNLPQAPIDGSQFDKVLRHVVRNAFEAYGEHLGSVRLSTSLSLLPSSAGDWPSPACSPGAGEHVVIEISDDGPGLDPALLSRIFDPFFTTKTGHKGIGLAEVAGVLRAHGGVIEVNARPAAGFCLRLFFPVAPVKGRREPGRRSPTKASTPPFADWKGSGQILVVDDEDTVRTVTAAMLESMGFTPLVARDGVECLRVLRQHGETVRVVLLDYSMPLLDGEATLAEISKSHPEIPVVFMSGLDERDIKVRGEDEQLVGVLSKPFPSEMLRQVLRRALGA